jgi:hypothetical protein
VRIKIILNIDATYFHEEELTMCKRNQTTMQAINVVHQQTNGFIDKDVIEGVLNDYHSYSGNVRVSELVDFYYENAANDSDFYSDEAA